MRTLIVMMLLAGPVCAWGWREWDAYRKHQDYERALKEIENIDFRNMWHYGPPPRVDDPGEE